MVVYIYFLLSFLSFYFYYKHKYAEMFLCLSMFVNELFGFAVGLGNSSIKSQDFLLVTIYIIILKEYIKEHHFWLDKDDKLGVIVFLCFIWTLIVFVGTIVLGVETPSYAFKAYRPFLVLPFFFVLKKMSMDDVNRYMQLMLFFSMVQGIFFYMQLIGFTGILAGYGSDIEEGTLLSEHRFGNYPSFAPFFFLFYLFNDNLRLYKKIFYLVFFGMMPIVGQMRGSVFALAIVSLLYFLIKRRKEHLYYVAFGIVAYVFIVMPMIDKRDEGKELGTFEEIKMVVSNPGNVYSNYEENSGQNFLFRIAMLFERIEYMSKHPNVALTGVGCIHEDSPRNTFRFNLGTTTTFADGKKHVNMLSSADIAWVGILMRYGYIGVLLFSFMLFIWIREGVPIVRDSGVIFVSIFALYSVAFYLSSFDCANLGRVNMLNMLFVMAVVDVYKRQRQNVLLDK